MDPQVQTCVVDATTLTDHIHGIKKLVYDGQLRVAVPLSTAESVEKIYQKSIEPKPEPKEAARPKSSGRPIRIYPTFNINPRVAREFLERCKLEDSKIGVEFQKEAEQYTPWKHIQEEEEEQKAPDAKPVDYAAALLKKLRTKETLIEASKGPAKPKLVARGPNGPNLPWKKSVPTISTDGVSANLRPILGYTLWRLHERETYSFYKDASILLTSDQKLRTAARKLGINVQSFDTLFTECKIVDMDLATWGDIEREFGVRPPGKAESRRQYSKPTEDAVTKENVEDLKGEELSQLQESGEVPSMNTEESKEAGQLKICPPEKDQGEAEGVKDFLPENIASSGAPASNGALDANIKSEGQAVDGEQTPTQPHQQEVAMEAPPAKPRAWADVVSNRIRPIEERYPSPAISTPGFAEPSNRDTEGSTDSSMEHVDQEKASTIADWVRMVTQASMDGETGQHPKSSHRKRSPRNKKTEKPSPPQEPPAKPFRPILMQRPAKSSQAASDHAIAISEKARTPSPSLSLPPVEPSQPTVDVPSNEPAVDIMPVSQHRSTDSTASSAQTVLSKDTSVAKSAHIEEPVDSDEEVVVFNPRAKRLSAQQQTSKPSEEKSVHTRQISEGKPIHARKPSVEESKKPDQTAPEKPALDKMMPEKTMPIMQHRSPKPRAVPVVIDPDAFGRDFASNPQTNQHRLLPIPSSQHGQIHSSHYGSPRGGGRGGRPFIHPQAITALQNGQHGRGNPNIRGGRQNRMPPAMTNGQNGYVATNQNNNPVNGNAGPSPRASPRVNPQALSQNGASEPDADFCLQSGPPRGSIRGRGRGKHQLWVG